MRNTVVVREWQQQAFVGDDTPIAVVDVRDGVDGKRALQALLVDRHYQWRESGPEIFFEASALAAMAVGAGHSRAVALDNQPRRLGALDDEKHEIRKFILDSWGLVFFDPWQQLSAGIKSQPRVQEITLLDRFDDRRVGAFEFQGCKFRGCNTV